MDRKYSYASAVYCRFQPRDSGKRIILAPALRTNVVSHLKKELLTIGHGESFASSLSFDGSPEIVLVCQRIGQTAALVDWRELGERRLAVSAVISGLDERDDRSAIETLRRVWLLPFSDNVFHNLSSRTRPVMGTFIVEEDGYDHPAIQNGVGCLGLAFGDLLGLIAPS